MLSVKELKTDSIVQVIASEVPDVFKQSLAKIVRIDTRDGFYMVTLEFLNPPRIDELGKAEYDLMTMTAPSETRN